MPRRSRLRSGVGIALAAVIVGGPAVERASSYADRPLALAAQPNAAPAQPALAWVDLLPPEGFDGWTIVSADGQAPDPASWSRKEGELHATGKPNGYLRTAQAYDEFILEFEWKYPEGAPGNSGVLVHIDGPDKVWPKCVQVQMLNDAAGRIFPMHGADAGDSAPSESLAAPVGSWNVWRLEAIGDHITLKVKKKDEWVEANTVIVRSPTKGYIGLQSEDSPVMFRKLRLAVPMKSEGEKPDAPKSAPPTNEAARES